MPTEHNTITDPEIHEPKGVAAAASGEVYVANGAGSGSWTASEDAVFPLATAQVKRFWIYPHEFQDTADINDADFDRTTGTYVFDAAVKEQVIGVKSLPDDLVSNSTIIPRIVWAKTDSTIGDVVWIVEYNVYNKNVAGAGWATAGSQSAVGDGTTDTNQAEKTLVSVITGISTTGYDEDTIILFRISRAGADVTDTYGNDARLLAIGFEYNADRIGN